jgi:hypothetical protein
MVRPIFALAGALDKRRKENEGLCNEAAYFAASSLCTVTAEPNGDFASNSLD